MSGKPCIVGTRITVGMIIMQISEGCTIDEILENYPDLCKDDILEIIQYASQEDILTLEEEHDMHEGFDQIARGEYITMDDYLIKRGITL